MARRKVDMSEAYDYMREKSGSYVLCFDVRHMTAFNDLSKKAGDLAILETAARIDRVATDDMLVMRIGGDEFALLTGLHDEQAAKAVADEVLKRNGDPIVFEEKAIPLSLWCGTTKIPETIRYNDLFNHLQKTIDASKLK